MEDKIKIAKVVTKKSLHDDGGDIHFWKTQTPQARIEALEQIRSEYHQWRYGAQPGFTRVYKITKRPAR